MSISDKKKENLLKEMDRLGIKESDLIEKFILGSGKGGQKLQKTHSCVYLKHIPSGIEVKCAQDRLRENNRFFARRRLIDKIKEIEKKEKSDKQKAAEKIRRQKKRRSRKTKEKMLQDKKARGQVKKLRRPPVEESD